MRSGCCLKEKYNVIPFHGKREGGGVKRGLLQFFVIKA